MLEGGDVLWTGIGHTDVLLHFITCFMQSVENHRDWPVHRDKTLIRLHQCQLKVNPGLNLTCRRRPASAS